MSLNLNLPINLCLYVCMSVGIRVPCHTCEGVPFLLPLWVLGTEQDFQACAASAHLLSYLTIPS